jgi:hypothetical protein
MDADERDICLYLKSLPGQFVSLREISRRAGGKHRFHENPEWAAPVLERLLERRLLETDSMHHFRLFQKGDDKPKKWVSPQIKAILEKSSKDFGKLYDIKDEDDSSEP